MPKQVSIDDCFKRLKYRADKAGYEGYISPDTFNLVWASAETQYFNKLYLDYPATRRSSESLSVFSKSVSITIDSNGQYSPPSDLIYIDSILQGTNEISRVEKDRVGTSLASTYDAPDADFPIYTQYNTYLQFYPTNLGSATMNYLGQPTVGYWGYTLAGSITGTGSLTGGSGYTNGTYSGIALQGGIGKNATANITVSGGAITSVTIVNSGVGYLVGDVLSAVIPAGNGFKFNVATIAVNTRPVYSANNSVQPLWSTVDIDAIVALALRDIGVNMGSMEVEQFANTSLTIAK